MFSYLIWQKCQNIKNYKKRIERILFNIINILDRADNNETINYDINSNRDYIHKGVYSDNQINNDISKLEYDDYFPKINPKFILLILKRFIIKTIENKKIDDFRINLALKSIFQLTEKYSKYYNYSIMLIDLIIEIFSNNMNVMTPYINIYAPQLKNIIQWLKNNPISPELYPIEGIVMYRDDNVAYKNDITEREKLKFNEEQMNKTEKKIQKLTNVLELKEKDYDYDYEADFDLTDFKFRKGDYIYYNKKKAIIKEFLDELILIKIIEDDKGENENNSNYNINEDNSKNKEKIQFWVAKDDKNLSIYSLE